MRRRARAVRRGGRRGLHEHHVATFALMVYLVFALTVAGTIGISVTGGATGFQNTYSQRLESYDMVAVMFILSLAFLIPAELMIRKSAF